MTPSAFVENMLPMTTRYPGYDPGLFKGERWLYGSAKRRLDALAVARGEKQMLTLGGVQVIADVRTPLAETNDA